jgi:hypothetical protein
MGKVADERTKLSATFMNGVAIAMVAAGSIAPLAALSYGLPNTAAGRTVALIGVGWLIGGLVLHFVARWSLRGISE